MANFSSFFPTASGGGGGFTKMKKISTLRSSDATEKVGFTTSVNISGDVLYGATTLVGVVIATADRPFFTAADSFVGMTFVVAGATHTVTASTAHSVGGYVTMTFTPALSAGQIANNSNVSFVGGSQTINPATDLGLEDGASIGFLLAGGNRTGVLRGTRIISNASTDLVINVGGSSGTASTITGGLTLTSADGSTDSSYSAASISVTGYQRHGSSGGNGVDGYGTGNQYYSNHFKHGWGGSGMDGAVLLYY